MIVICIVIWFVWPKTIVFGWVKIVVDSKHVIHKIGKNIIINRNKNSLDKPFVSLCNIGTISESTIEKYLESPEVKQGSLPVVPGLPTILNQNVSFYNVNEMVELNIPYLPLCFGALYNGNLLKPDDLFSAHKAYLFMVNNGLYEMIYFYDTENFVELNQIIKRIYSI